jgi:uncharacterized protein (DUF952 family)
VPQWRATRHGPTRQTVRVATIHHVTTPDGWAAFQAAGETRQSTRDRSLEEEGFVHCSYADQLEGTLARFYADLPVVVVLTLDTDRIPSAVVDEPTDDGAVFPHVYGPLPLDAVVGVDERSPG